MGANAALEFYKLPQTGSYTLYVQRNSTSGTSTATVTLNQVPALQSLGAVSIGGSTSATVSGYQSAFFTFAAPAGTAGRVTLTSTLTSASGSPFVVSVTGPDGFSQVYSSGSPIQGDLEGFNSPGQVDFSGPILVPTLPAGSTYTVTYQSLSSNSTTVRFQLASLPADVLASGGCSAWPASGSTTSCSGTISTPGQALYATLASTSVFEPGSTSQLVGALQTTATNFSGCFEVLLTDTGLNQQFYRAVQCGGSDFSYSLSFPTGSIGPYLVQAFGLGQNTGSLQFTLSAGPTLASATLKTATFTSAGQSQILSYHPSPSPGAGNWLTFTTSEPSGWTQCFVVSLNAQGTNAPFASYLQCPPPGPTGSLGLLELPSASSGAGKQVDNYYVQITPAGSQSGTVTFTATAASAPAANTIPVNGSVYSTSVTTASSYSFTPTLGAGSFVNVLTEPNISATNSPSPCFDLQIAQGSKTLFDSSISQSPNDGFEVNNTSCSGLDMSAFPASQPLGSAASGSVTFTPSSQLQSPSGNFGLTLYNYNTVAASTTLSLAASGPAGVTLPSTLPGQPVSVNFSTSSTSGFAKLVVGLDAQLQSYSVVVQVQDTTTNKVLISSPASGPSSTFTLTLPSPAGDTYQVSVSPQGDAVGFVTIGVGAQ